MIKPEIILVGGGGHCHSCIEAIESEGVYSIKGIIDLPHLLGSSTFGYSVIGTDDDLSDFISQGYSFLVTMGHMGNAYRREYLFEKIKSLGGLTPSIKASTAYVSKFSTVAEGSVILHGAIVNANVTIGKNSIVNSKALVEHDSVIGNHCHISTGVIVNGDCSIGNHSFIGSGTVIKNGLKLVSRIIIGSSSLVLNSISKEGIYFGNPVTFQGENK